MLDYDDWLGDPSPFEMYSKKYSNRVVDYFDENFADPSFEFVLGCVKAFLAEYEQIDDEEYSEGCKIFARAFDGVDGYIYAYAYLDMEREFNKCFEDQGD